MTSRRALAQRREGFLTGKKVSECEKSQSGVGERFSHEVALGDSHGREPVEQHSAVVLSPEGTTGNNAKRYAYRPFGTFRLTCCNPRARARG